MEAKGVIQEVLRRADALLEQPALAFAVTQLQELTHFVIGPAVKESCWTLTGFDEPICTFSDLGVEGRVRAPLLHQNDTHAGNWGAPHMEPGGHELEHQASGQGKLALSTVEHIYDLTGVIPNTDNLQSVQPDFSGRLWFTSDGGVVGTLDTEANNGEGQVLGTYQLPGGEVIENGTAIDETGGVYLDSSQAMYRFDADENGAPSITWREPYDAGTHVKVVSRGSGTTPTLMGTEYVAIADNADPQIHVLVYRRAKEVEGPRLVCAEPVFQPGQSMTEDSFIATDRSIIVENNSGYTAFNRVENGSTTKPGITRVDIDEDGNGCHIVWTNMETAPIIVPKLSLANGLIYTYTKTKGPANTDAWYFTAIDFHTGETVYKVLAGTGSRFNSHMGVIYLSPDGTAYVGVLDGVVRIQDRE